MTETAKVPADNEDGIWTTIVVEFQLTTCGARPPKLILLAPCEEPRLAPAMIRYPPALPFADAGARLGMTVNGNELLAIPPSVTVAVPSPGAAPTGT
jgi:hypothetical protein